MKDDECGWSQGQVLYARASLPSLNVHEIKTLVGFEDEINNSYHVVCR
jgi:hypothetical protein